jgi:hypothetical protein
MLRSAGVIRSRLWHGASPTEGQSCRKMQIAMAVAQSQPARPCSRGSAGADWTDMAGFAMLFGGSGIEGCGLDKVGKLV